MVKEHKKKRNRGITKFPKAISLGKKTATPLKIAFVELKILFYLKNSPDGVQKSALDDVLGSHNYVREMACDKLEKNNFIRMSKTGKKTSIYKITDKGKEVCKYLLDIINEKDYEIGWFTLIKKIRISSMKNVGEV